MAGKCENHDALLVEITEIKNDVSWIKTINKYIAVCVATIAGSLIVAAIVAVAREIS